MRSNTNFWKGFRRIFYPIALLSGLYIFLRNKFYDWNWIRPVRFNFPIICVGNLSVGGTGKSPMIEMLVEWLQPFIQPATLSRGYKRKTKGYLLANDLTSALEIGDEPMQFHLKFPNLPVAVGESRTQAVPLLLHDAPQTGVILLDDAFQHRKIHAGYNIVLTEFSNPFWSDWYLPAGDLRDLKQSANRAQTIVVTKCPEDLGTETAGKFRNEIQQYAPKASVYFTALQYGIPIHYSGDPVKPYEPDEVILLVAGIANPLPLRNHIERHVHQLHEIRFADHHIFSIDDLLKISETFAGIEAEKKRIITTEKDFVRLVKFGKELENLQLYVQPVRHKVLFKQEGAFKYEILNFALNFRKE